MDDRYEEIIRLIIISSKERSKYIDDKMRMLKIQMEGFPEKEDGKSVALYSKQGV